MFICISITNLQKHWVFFEKFFCVSKRKKKNIYCRKKVREFNAIIPPLVNTYHCHKHQFFLRDRGSHGEDEKHDGGHHHDSVRGSAFCRRAVLSSAAAAAPPTVPFMHLSLVEKPEVKVLKNT